MSAVEIQLILQAIGIVLVLGGAMMGGYMKLVNRIGEDKSQVTNRLTAIETKLSNGLMGQVQHLMSEGVQNSTKIQELRSRLERMALDLENHKAGSHARQEGQ